ncbi:hypothetical protein, partial [Nonomuraea sp. SBT364]|uniref:hypothetical protein n=1 Tax=Nonomuraea sp. SBT364 TaxID=1580530 RepID=UPI00066C3A57
HLQHPRDRHHAHQRDAERGRHAGAGAGAAAHTPPATPVIPPGDDTGKAISTVPDLCETLTDEQVAQLVLNPHKPQSYLAGSCSWSSDISIDVPDRLTMDLRVQVKLSPDAAEAAKTFGLSREMAARMSTSSYSEMVNWPPRPITGLGNEAYATDTGHRSILGPSFTANVTFRLSNAIVEVEYGRDVAEDSRMRERAVQAARWIGQAIAHGD